MRKCYQVSFETLGGGSSIPIEFHDQEFLVKIFDECITNLIPNKQEIPCDATFLDALDTLDKLRDETQNDYNVLRFHITLGNTDIFSKQYIWVASTWPNANIHILTVISSVVKILDHITNKK